MALEEKNETSEEASSSKAIRISRRISKTFSKVVGNEKDPPDLPISAPVFLEHRAHVGLDSDGTFKGPTPELIAQLNRELQKLGASGVTEEEIAFLNSKFASGIPCDPQAARESLRVKTKHHRKQVGDVITVAVETPKTQLALTQEQLEELEAQNVLLEAENKSLKEKLEAAGSKVVALEAAKQVAEDQLTEAKEKLFADVKKLESEVMYLKRKAHQTEEKNAKTLLEEKNLRIADQKTIAKLKKEIEELKEQVKTAMNMDVQLVVTQYESKLSSVKEELEKQENELKQTIESMKREMEKLEENKESLSIELEAMTVKVHELEQAKLDVAELKRTHAKEMQQLKGQLLAEIKKLKEKLEAERQARQKISEKYQSTLSQENKNDSSQPVPPPPPVDHPRPVKKKDPKEEKHDSFDEPVLRSVSEDTVANVLAFALLARRQNIAERSDEEQETSGDDVEWED